MDKPHTHTHMWCIRRVVFTQPLFERNSIFKVYIYIHMFLKLNFTQPLWEYYCTNAVHGRGQNVSRKSWTGTGLESNVLYGTNPGINSPLKNNCTAAYILSLKPPKADEDMRDTAEEIRTSSKEIFSYGPLHTNMQMMDDHLELINNSSVRTQDVDYNTCRKRWTIWTNSERERVREIHTSSANSWW